MESSLNHVNTKSCLGESHTATLMTSKRVGLGSASSSGECCNIIV